MKSIKIIAGSYGWRPENSRSVTLITRQHGPIEVSDAEAERLIALGVAVIVERDLALVRPEPEKPVPAAAPQEEDVEEQPAIPRYSMKDTAVVLRAYLDAESLSHEPGMTKAQLIDALDAYYGSPEDPDEESPEAEDAPDLKAGSPVVL